MIERGQNLSLEFQHMKTSPISLKLVGSTNGHNAADSIPLPTSMNRTFHPALTKMGIKPCERLLWVYLCGLSGNGAVVGWQGEQVILGHLGISRKSLYSAVDGLQSRQLISLAGPVASKGGVVSLFFGSLDSHMVRAERIGDQKKSPPEQTTIETEKDMTEDEKVLVCSSHEIMTRYIRFGISGINESDITKLKPTVTDWANVPGYTPETPMIETWSDRQLAGAYWYMVTEYREKHGIKITLPNWGVLVRNMKSMVARRPKVDCFNYFIYMVNNFDLLRFMCGNNFNIELNEITLNNSVMEQSVIRAQSMTQDEYERQVDRYNAQFQSQDAY